MINTNDFFNSGYMQIERPKVAKSRSIIDSSEESSESETSTSLDGFIRNDSSEISEYGNDEDMDMEASPFKNRYPSRSENLKKRAWSSSSNDMDPHPLKKRATKSPSKKKKYSPIFFPVSGTDKSIIGREDEAKQIIAMLKQPQGGMRPLLLGARGIGKYSVIAKVAELYATKLKGSFWNCKGIDCINCRELIAKYPGENNSEDIILKLKELVAEHLKVKSEQSVLYLRDIECLMLMPQVSEYLQTLFKYNVSFIASIAEDAKNEKILPVIKTLSQYNFSNIEIKESPIEDICQIVQHHLLKHENDQKISYNKESIELGCELAAKYLSFPPLPMRAINSIQECGSHIMLDRYLSGDETPLVITAKDISLFISTKTGIAPEDLLDDSIFNEKKFVAKLKEKIVGQDYAINIVAEQVATWKMGLLSPGKPWGVFLFVGPTGVGKSQLAKQLARQLFQNEANMIILDGSEYKESHSASNLIGAPRGYEGYDSGGMLTGPLLENPYRVVLFDEFEKAHDEVRKLFLQVFEDGRLTDRRGKVADCSKALFLMTSNLGANDLFFKPETSKLSHADLISQLKPTLVEHLSAEMCGRFSGIVPFMPIEQKHLSELAKVRLLRIKENLSKQTQIELQWTPKLIKKLSSIEKDLRFGGRDFCKDVENLVTQSIKTATVNNKIRLKGKISLDVSTKNEIVVKIIK